MNVLIKNSIRCKKCGDVIESNKINDLHKCSCGACSIDGGLMYPRIYAANHDDYDNLSEVGEVEGCVIYIKTHYGSKCSLLCPISCANDVIRYHEDELWDYVCVVDEEGNIIYKSRGFDDTH